MVPATILVAGCFRKVGKEKDAFFVSARTRLSPRDGSVFLTPLRFFHGKPPQISPDFFVLLCAKLILVVNEIENYVLVMVHRFREPPKGCIKSGKW